MYTPFDLEIAILEIYPESLPRHTQWQTPKAANHSTVHNNKSSKGKPPINCQIHN